MAAGVISAPSVLRAGGAAERLTLGLVGCGGQGYNHLRMLTNRDDVEIAALCDIDVPKPEDAPTIESHHDNFFAAIRGRAELNAEIEVGHRSAALCHLGNLATRLRRLLEFDAENEQIVGDDEANQMLARQYRDHWSVPVKS